MTFSEGMFRTPQVNSGLDCNPLTIKKKGLLDFEQPSVEITYCGERVPMPQRALKVYL